MASTLPKTYIVIPKLVVRFHCGCVGFNLSVGVECVC